MSLTLFQSLAGIHRHDDLEGLLDSVARTIAATTGWATALLTFYLGDEVHFGAEGCPPGTKERFRQSWRTTSRERRERKREAILRYQRPGTNICFVPAGEGPSRAGAFVPSRDSGGSWHSDDRLFIVLRDWEDRILGLLSLDNPRNGDRPDDRAFEELEEIDRYANIVAKVAENRFWSRRLRESEAAYRAIFDATTDGFVITDPEGTIVQANPAACRMHGYGYDEIIGTPARDLIHADDHPKFEKFLETVGGGEEFHVEARDVRRDKTAFDIEVRGTSFQYLGRPHCLAVIQDLTEKKRALRSLLEQQKDESIVAVAGGVAHDFNNILMGITGSIGLLEQAIPPDSEARRQCGRIAASAEKLSRVTDQLLAIARGVHSPPRPVSLARIVEENLPLVKGMADTGFEVELALAPDTGSVYGDRVQIAQLLLNLCQNAFEAMDRGGLLRVSTGNVRWDRPFTDARTGHHAAGEYVRLRVEDDGHGLGEAALARLFEPYYSTKENGSGLGLAAVLGIVRRHHGAIDIKSEGDSGTRVEVLFPRSRLTEPMEVRPMGRESGQRRILLVEDDDVVREVATEMLESLGYGVVPVDGGEEAIEIYEARGSDIDLVLLDVTMPGLSGPETHEAIRAIDSEVRVVFSSGHAERLMTEGLEGDRRIAAFLQKPYSLDALKQTIERALG